MQRDFSFEAFWVQLKDSPNFKDVAEMIYNRGWDEGLQNKPMKCDNCGRNTSGNKLVEHQEELYCEFCVDSLVKANLW